MNHDLRISGSSAFPLNPERLYQQNRSPVSKVESEESNFLQVLQDQEAKLKSEPSRDQVLSLPEMAALHMLFGSQKPDDQGFYGLNNSSQIYKGHLLDVAG